MKIQLSLAAAAAAIALAACGGGGGPDLVPFTAAVFGDVPYGTTPTDASQTQAFPNFVNSVNADRDVSFAVHVGDIHSGKQYCTQAYDQQVLGLFKAFTVPLVYTPGDNEWADCHKPGEGGGSYSAATGAIAYVTDAGGKPVDYASGNPVDNLALVRSLFFRRPARPWSARCPCIRRRTSSMRTSPAMRSTWRTPGSSATTCSS